MKLLIGILVIFTILFFVYIIFSKSEYGKQCGGFMGETGELRCPKYLKCVYKESIPDASGECKLF